MQTSAEPSNVQHQQMIVTPPFTHTYVHFLSPSLSLSHLSLSFPLSLSFSLFASFLPNLSLSYKISLSLSLTDIHKHFANVQNPFSTPRCFKTKTRSRSLSLLLVLPILLISLSLSLVSLFITHLSLSSISILLLPLSMSTNLSLGLPNAIPLTAFILRIQINYTFVSVLEPSQRDSNLDRLVV